MKKTLKQKFKSYWTDKPKSDFWMWAFITVVLFRWFTPTVLIMMVPFQIGLISPDTEVNYTSISEKVAGNIVKPMQTLNGVGKNISNNNPQIAFLISTALGYFTWFVWASMIVLVLNLIRYAVSFIYRKYNSIHQKRKKALNHNKGGKH